MAFWSGSLTLSIQSQARPSECSVSPLLQFRVMPPVLPTL